MSLKEILSNLNNKYVQKKQNGGVVNDDDVMYRQEKYGEVTDKAGNRYVDTYTRPIGNMILEPGSNPDDKKLDSGSYRRDYLDSKPLSVMPYVPINHISATETTSSNKTNNNAPAKPIDKPTAPKTVKPSSKQPKQSSKEKKEELSGIDADVKKVFESGDISEFPSDSESLEYLSKEFDKRLSDGFSKENESKYGSLKNQIDSLRFGDNPTYKDVVEASDFLYKNNAITNLPYEHNMYDKIIPNDNEPEFNSVKDASSFIGKSNNNESPYEQEMRNEIMAQSQVKDDMKPLLISDIKPKSPYDKSLYLEISKLIDNYNNSKSKAVDTNKKNKK